MKLVMSGEIHGLFPHYGKIIDHFLGMARLAHPLAVDPCPYFMELAEIDLRVKVGGEVFTVNTRIDVHNIDGVDGVEMMLYRERAVGVHHAGVKTGSQDRGNAFFPAAVFPLP